MESFFMRMVFSYFSMDGKFTLPCSTTLFALSFGWFDKHDRFYYICIQYSLMKVIWSSRMTCLVDRNFSLGNRGLRFFLRNTFPHKISRVAVKIFNRNKTCWLQKDFWKDLLVTAAFLRQPALLHECPNSYTHCNWGKQTRRTFFEELA